ncbi:MAG TPA: TerB family tellurite resistance protein [Flavisolibacter sp.]|nr:TerB family tellurite resistance protein [Flavisolibacter sp.]
MEKHTVLEGYGDMEKGAYLGAIASIATADREASEEELSYIRELCEAAQLSDEQMRAVEGAAIEMSGEELKRCLDTLKNSELRYSLVADLIAFAKSDQDYSEEEQQNVQKISTYLGVDKQQFTLLDQFAQKATEQPVENGGSNVQNMQNFGGLQEKMKGAGINTGGLFKGLLSMAAPLLIGGMLSRGFGRRSGGGLGGMLGGGGGLGGMLGGMMGGGGLGSMLGGGGMGGGLGSVIGMLSGGRGMGSTGGLLGRMLGGRF